MLTGELKKELVDTLTLIVSPHQEVRKTITDEMAMEFMRPRSLNFNAKSAATMAAGKKIEPFLDAAALQKLDGHLLDHSYVHGFQFSEADVILSSHANDAKSFDHINRWLSHISALHAEKPVALGKDAKADIFSLYGTKIELLLHAVLLLFGFLSLLL